MRFGDTDALGHVNNASFASYAEVARLEFLRRLGKSVTSLILASLYVDFRRQVEFDDRVYMETWVERLGRSSVTLGQTVFANDKQAAEIRSVVVHFDYATSTSQELTAEMRQAMEPFVKESKA
ncbi:MAG: thioesterase superfamily protein [Gemmatimonadetes bacterium]|nr:thioesterase superfamily protein [Gemmatimonadota bacterium]